MTNFLLYRFFLAVFLYTPSQEEASLARTMKFALSCVWLFSFFFLGGRADPDLVYLDGESLHSYDLTTGARSTPLPSEFFIARAMDYDYRRQKLYICDVFFEKIYSVDMSKNPPTTEVILDTGIDTPEGLAVDYVNNRLYWTDQGENN